MDNTTNFCNHYKFGVYVNNQMINERIFSGDEYNQVVKYQIDLRPIINDIQRSIKNVLSSKSLTYKFNEYNTLKYFTNNNIGYDNIDNIEETSITINKKTNGKDIKKTYTGVEVKIGFYLNTNPIFERSVYVSNYNPKARFSVEFHETIQDIVNDIKTKIKSDDMTLMWEDFDLMNNYGFAHISQVRELSTDERNRLLKRIK